MLILFHKILQKHVRENLQSVQQQWIQLLESHVRYHLANTTSNLCLPDKGVNPSVDVFWLWLVRVNLWTPYPRIKRQLYCHSFSGPNGMNCIKFGEDTRQSLMRHMFVLTFRHAAAVWNDADMVGSKIGDFWHPPRVPIVFWLPL